MDFVVAFFIFIGLVYLVVKIIEWIFKSLSKIISKANKNSPADLPSNQHRADSYRRNSTNTISSTPRTNNYPSRPYSSPTSTNTNSRYSSPTPANTNPSTSIYAYRPNLQSRTITNPPRFVESSKEKVVENFEISDLHDALTGAPLEKSRGLFQCKRCKVFYHRESYELLKEINSSKCASCQSTDIFPIVSTEKGERGAEFNPNKVTLQNYYDYVGNVVTFEGQVCTVHESQRGGDFAVMFEQKGWVQGFKLVFFRGTLKQMGGARYLYSLVGKRVRVRGLIIRHERYGYEIVVSEKSMILGIA